MRSFDQRKTRPFHRAATALAARAEIALVEWYAEAPRNTRDAFWETATDAEKKIISQSCGSGKRPGLAP